MSSNARESDAPTAVVGRASGRQTYAPRAPLVDDYNDGYAPELRPSPTGVPDDIRTGYREPIRAPRWQRRRALDRDARQSDETVVAGWDVKQAKVPAGQNPMWSQERLPIRPTADDAPMGYLFTRPWQRPQSTGEHLSMADHRRAYEIRGMAPRGGVGVNTYRADPTPWDQTLYAHGATMPDEPVGAPVALGGSRTYRAGG